MKPETWITIFVLFLSGLSLYINMQNEISKHALELRIVKLEQEVKYQSDNLKDWIKQGMMYGLK